MTDNDLREQLGRLLERTEEQGKQISRVLANGEARDAKMQDNLVRQTLALQDAKKEITDTLSDRVRAAVHDQRNDQQTVVNKIVARLNEVDDNVKAIDQRVDKLEEPMHRALAIRLKRRKVFVKLVAWASTIGVASWAVFEPVWKFVAVPLARWAAKKIFGVDIQP